MEDLKLGISVNSKQLNWSTPKFYQMDCVNEFSEYARNVLIRRNNDAPTYD
jgi:hypothetical protein